MTQPLLSRFLLPLLATLVAVPAFGQSDPCAADYAISAIIGAPANPHQAGVTFSFGPKTTCNGDERAAVFEISNDNASYLPLASAPYLSGVREGSGNGLRQAIFTVGPSGTYYLRARVDTGDVVGPTTVVAN